MSENAYPMLLGRTLAAKMTGISVRTLDKLRKNGQIRCFKTPGGQNRFHKASLLDYISKNTRFNPTDLQNEDQDVR